MASILLIDADADTRTWLGAMLQTERHAVVLAINGRDGVIAARRLQPDIVVVDPHLPDVSGIDVIRSVCQACPGAVIAVVTGDASIDGAVEAMQSGARTYMKKPVEHVRLRVLLDQLSSSGRQDQISIGNDAANHAAERWASVVVPLIDSPSDVRTLTMWARCVAVSTGTIRNWCHTAHLSARHSLQFGRLLRTVVRHRLHGTPTEELLDVVDARTLTKLLRLGRSDAPATSRLPATIESFLTEQRWIINAAALEVVITLLRGRHLMTPGRADAYTTHAAVR